MKKSHRFSEPYPENPRKARVKQTGRTKIELDLKDALSLADILYYKAVLAKPLNYFSFNERQLISLLVKKLRNAEPELEF